MAVIFICTAFTFVWMLPLADAQAPVLLFKYVNGSELKGESVAESTDIVLECQFKTTALSLAQITVSIVTFTNANKLNAVEQILCTPATKVVKNALKSAVVLRASPNNPTCNGSVFSVNLKVADKIPRFYGCEINVKASVTKLSSNVKTLRSFVAPSGMFISNIPLRPREGRMALYTCTASGRPPPNLILKYNGIVQSTTQKPPASQITLNSPLGQTTITWNTTAMPIMNGKTLRCEVVDHVSKAELYKDHSLTVRGVNDCVPNKCINAGTCTDLINDFSCSCQAGWTGKTCELDINDCMPNKCLNGGFCKDGFNNYTCICGEGWSGRNCEKPNQRCSAYTCSGHGKCYEVLGGTTACACDSGYTSGHCEQEINDCDPSKCLNGGTCIDRLNDFSCTCPSGWTGKRCESDVNDCSPTNCLNGGTCIDRLNGFICLCKPGWTGKACENATELCTEGTCSGHGKCYDVSGGTVICACDAGYTSKFCEQEINDCDPSKCLNGGTCTDRLNDFSCTCPSGWTGKRCDSATERCFEGTCSGHGKCYEVVGGKTICVCDLGYTSTHCEQEINECHQNQCLNNATCVDRVNGYSCICQSGWTGKHCETDVNDCSPASCLNGGTCMDKLNDFSCSCKPGWTGKACEQVDCTSKDISVKIAADERTKAVEISPGVQVYFSEGKHLFFVPDANCTVRVTVNQGFPLKRRLDFQANYSIGCKSVANDDVITVLNAVVTEKFTFIEHLCDKKCNRSPTGKAEISCKNDITTVTWPTSTVYDEKITSVPGDILAAIRSRITSHRNELQVVVLAHAPPVINPNMNGSGELVSPVLTPVCESGTVYDDRTDSCRRKV